MLRDIVHRISGMFEIAKTYTDINVSNSIMAIYVCVCIYIYIYIYIYFHPIEYDSIVTTNEI